MTPEQRREQLRTLMAEALFRHRAVVAASTIENWPGDEAAPLLLRVLRGESEQFVDALLEVVNAAIAEARDDERRNTAEHIAQQLGQLADRAGELEHYERAALYSDAERIARDEAGDGP